ncbi:hypothetical protein COCOBI_16-4330 [Coccomyxa sp. Obi]|nr:hypothetical protein COCOBI_16-4330 [Coccomyxa sp. Obi]
MFASATTSKFSLGCSCKHQKAPRSCASVSVAGWDPVPQEERLIKARVPQHQAHVHLAVMSDALNYAVGSLRKDIGDLTKEVIVFKQEVVVSRLQAENKLDKVKQEVEVTRLQLEKKLDMLGVNMKWAAAVVIVFVASIFGQTDIVKTFITSISRMMS